MEIKDTVVIIDELDTGNIKRNLAIRKTLSGAAIFGLLYGIGNNVAGLEPEDRIMVLGGERYKGDFYSGMHEPQECYENYEPKPQKPWQKGYIPCTVKANVGSPSPLFTKLFEKIKE